MFARISFFLALLTASAGILPAVADTFGDHWFDGRAELDGYRWTGQRYGETRNGTAVMIFVTEPFSRSKFVKVDDPSKNPGDTFTALKLNMIRDFQTGIYDYNTMVSVFAHSDDFRPAKVSFSSAEWCGHAYQDLQFEKESIRQRFFSYFEDESVDTAIQQESDGVAEDNLFILLRGLRGEYLKPGEKKTVPFLPGAFVSRLAHRSLDWGEAEIERLSSPQEITVPAGTFSAAVYVVRAENGREGRFHIETDYPHRVLRWQWGAGDGSTTQQWLGSSETGELAGSVRLPYWELNANGNESYLKELGIPAAGP